MPIASHKRVGKSRHIAIEPSPSWRNTITGALLIASPIALLTQAYSISMA